MRTPHDQSVQILGTRRPTRCLRHRVWMAACDDCRDAHRDALRDAVAPAGQSPAPAA